MPGDLAVAHQQIAVFDNGARHGVWRDGEVRAHRFDQAVAHRDCAVLNGRASDRDNAGILDGKSCRARRL